MGKKFKVVVDGSKLKFSACHFLKEPKQCSRIHGHNYYVSVKVSDNLNKNEFVMDFIELKELVQSIIQPLDHYVLIPAEAEDLKVKKLNNSIDILFNGKNYVFPREDVRFLPITATSSELLAKYIHDRIKETLHDKKITVKVRESDSTMAIYSG